MGSSPSPESVVIDLDAADVRELKRPKLSFGNNRQFVESIHLSTLIASYNHHFAKYSELKKNFVQLIPGAV
jgi:hypothetical protein